MRQTIKYEFWVGLFLLLGIAALVFLGLRVANVQGFGETKSYTVTASIAINEEYKEIPENSSLSIKTSGLLGEQYIALSMGFDDGETAMLKNGSQIQDTKSAMVLEDLIGQFLYGDKKSDGNADKAESDVK